MSDPNISADAQIERLRVCRNACRSIPTPALEAGVVDMMKRYFDVSDALNDTNWSQERVDELDNLHVEIIKLLEVTK